MSTTSGSDDAGQYPSYPNMPPPGSGPQYGQQPYGQQPYGQPYGQPQWGAQQKTGTNGLSIAALVLGILPVFGIGAILAIVFGFIARGQIDRGAQSGRGMATAGIILGSLWIVAFIALIIFAATHHGTSCVGTPGYCPQN